MNEPRSVDSRPLIALLLTVCTEYLVLSVSFDAAFWLDHVGLRDELGAIKLVGPAVLIAIAALVVLGGSQAKHALRELAQAQPPAARRRALLTAHLISFAALYAFAGHLFVPPFGSVDHAGLWLLAWLFVGALTLALLVAAFTEIGAIYRLLRRNASLVVIAVVMALLAWQAGTLASQFWRHTSGPMMHVLGTLVVSLFESGFVDPSNRTLGTSRFVIEIAPACSGYEGIGLIIVFLSGYLFMARAQLRLPNALIVIPIGIVTAWIVNLVRIIALVAVGHHISPTVAVSGFHANAGWVLFCFVAVTLVYSTDRVFSRDRYEAPSTINRAPTAYLGPLLAAIATSLVTALFATELDPAYGLRYVAAALVLWRYRKLYEDLRWRFSWVAVAIGVATALVWLYLIEPPASGVAAISAELDALPPLARGLWLANRLVGFVIFAPIIEELAFRGYIMRRIQHVDFMQVPLTSWSAPAVLVSAIAFGAVHANFAAGMLAGLLFSLAAIHRGRLSDAIAAHVTANAVLGVIGFVEGAYWLW